MIATEDLIGFEFEFYSKLNSEDIIKIFSKELNKKIVIEKALKGFDEYAIPNHTSIEPTRDTFKLEYDYSGGQDLYEFVTGPCPIDEAKKILKKTFDLISLYGWTDKRAGIHINCSLSDIGRKYLKDIDILKFIMKFDEDFIYQRFPDRMDNVYSKSIYLLNVDTFDYNDRNSNYDKIQHINIPKTKYFGVNFSKLEKNYLEFRYLGGAQYEEKYKKTIQVIDYIFEFLHSFMLDDTVTKEERERFNERTKNLMSLNKHEIKEKIGFYLLSDNLLLPLDDFSMITIYNNYTNLIINKILCKIVKDSFDDLKSSEVIYLKDTNDLQSLSNYDVGKNIKFQVKYENFHVIIKDLDLKNVIMDVSIFPVTCFKNCRFRTSEINGNYNIFKDCKIEDSILEEQYLTNCKIKDCKIRNCILIECVVEDSYLDIEEQIPVCRDNTFIKSVIRRPLESKNIFKKCRFVEDDTQQAPSESVSAI